MSHSVINEALSIHNRLLGTSAALLRAGADPNVAFNPLALPLQNDSLLTFPDGTTGCCSLFEHCHCLSKPYWVCLPGGTCEQRKEEIFEQLPQQAQARLVHLYCEYGLDPSAPSDSGDTPLSLLLSTIDRRIGAGNEGYGEHSCGLRIRWEDATVQRELKLLWSQTKQVQAARAASSSGNGNGSGLSSITPAVDLLHTYRLNKPLLAQQIVSTFSPVFEPKQQEMGTSGSSSSTITDTVDVLDSLPADVIAVLCEIYMAARDQLSAVESMLVSTIQMLPGSTFTTISASSLSSTTCSLCHAFDCRRLTNLVRAACVMRMSKAVLNAELDAVADDEDEATALAAGRGGLGIIAAGTKPLFPAPTERVELHGLLGLLVHESIHPSSSPPQPLHRTSRRSYGFADVTVALACRLGDVSAIMAVLAGLASGVSSLILITERAVPTTDAGSVAMVVLRLAVSALVHHSASTLAVQQMRLAPDNCGSSDLALTLTHLLPHCRTAAAVRLLVDSGADVNLVCCGPSADERKLDPRTTGRQVTPLVATILRGIYEKGAAAIAPALVAAGADVGRLVPYYLPLINPRSGACLPLAAGEGKYSDRQNLRGMWPHFHAALTESVWGRRKFAIAARERLRE